jgi:hypothetical protein
VIRRWCAADDELQTAERQKTPQKHEAFAEGMLFCYLHFFFFWENQIDKATKKSTHTELYYTLGGFIDKTIATAHLLYIKRYCAVFSTRCADWRLSPEQTGRPSRIGKDGKGFAAG